MSNIKENSICGICSEKLMAQEVSCNYCEKEYHYKCSMSITKYRAMSRDEKKKWKCNKCVQNEKMNIEDKSTEKKEIKGVKSHLEKNDNMSDSEEESSEDEKEEPTPENILKYLKVVHKKVTKIDEVNKKVNIKVNKIDDEIMEMKTNLEFLSKKYDDITFSISNIEKKNKESNKKIEENTQRSNENEEQIKILRDNFDQMEQNSRKLNVEIHGVKKFENENTEELVVKISNILFKEKKQILKNIVVAHRIRTSNQKKNTEPIMLKLVNEDEKRKWLVEGKRCKINNNDIYQNGDKTKVFFNENLTSIRKKLLWETKKLAKEKQYKFVWVKNGKILVRKNEQSQILRIHSVKDLDKIEKDKVSK